MKCRNGYTISRVYALSSRATARVNTIQIRAIGKVRLMRSLARLALARPLDDHLDDNSQTLAQSTGQQVQEKVLAQGVCRKSYNRVHRWYSGDHMPKNVVSDLKMIVPALVLEMTMLPWMLAQAP